LLTIDQLLSDVRSPAHAAGIGMLESTLSLEGGENSPLPSSDPNDPGLNDSALPAKKICKKCTTVAVIVLILLILYFLLKE
jgi:hypothetical protein